MFAKSGWTWLSWPASLLQRSPVSLGLAEHVAKIQLEEGNSDLEAWRRTSDGKEASSWRLQKDEKLCMCLVKIRLATVFIFLLAVLQSFFLLSFWSFCFGALQDSESNFNHRMWIRCNVKFQDPVLQFTMCVYVCACGRLIEKGNYRMVFTNFVLNIDHGIAWSPERKVVLRFYVSYRLLRRGWVVWWTSRRWQKIIGKSEWSHPWGHKLRLQALHLQHAWVCKHKMCWFYLTRSKLEHVFTPFAWLLHRKRDVEDGGRVRKGTPLTSCGSST